MQLIQAKSFVYGIILFIFRFLIYTGLNTPTYLTDFLSGHLLQIR